MTAGGSARWPGTTSARGSQFPRDSHNRTSWQTSRYGFPRQLSRRGAVVKVRDAMTEEVLTFTPGRSLRAAAKFMADHNVGAGVVEDPEQPGPGIITVR